MAWLKTIAIRLFLLYGFVVILGYVIFRAWFIAFSPYFLLLSIFLFIAELHNALQLFTMVYSLWPRKYPTFNKIYRNKRIGINIFICVCGEPKDIVEATINAAKKASDMYASVIKPIQKPHIVVLNDGYAAKKDNWKDVQLLCKKLGIKHVQRTTTKGFKAGNINNGLRITPTKDPNHTLDIVLDADFAVVPEFILEITKPFSDTTIDFVQTPQRYKQMDTWVAQAAADHQKHFFEYVCPAKAYDNALFLCGTNFAIRRSALNSVGNMDERFITEDYATSLNLHLQGKKGTLIKKPLAYGIAPSSLKAYFSQQRRWSKGTFDTSLAYWKEILHGSLTPAQRFQYIVSSLYYLSGFRNLIFMVAPLPYLFFGVFLLKTNLFNFFTLIYAPLFLYNFSLYFLLFDHPLKAWVLDTISFPVYVGSLISSLLKKDLAFVVTIKNYQKENIFHVFRMQLIVAVLLIAGFISAIAFHHLGQSTGGIMNYFWALFNIFVLLLGFYLFLKDNYKEDVHTLTMRWLHMEAEKVLSSIEKGFIVIGTVGFSAFLFFHNPFIGLFPHTFSPTNVLAEATIPQEILVPSTGVYYGYYLPSLNIHPQKPIVTLVRGEKTSLAMYYQDFSDDKPFDISYMNALNSQDVIPVLTWEPWNAQVGVRGKIVQPNYTPKSIALGKYDAFIHQFASEVASYKKPFFLRFAHEMNGDWYTWGNISGNTPADYVAMWRHVHDIFTEEGATNATWVWAPNNVDNQGSTSNIMSYYPGDAYVDWVGFSGFNWGQTSTAGWKSFSEIAYAIYPTLAKLNKPIMVAETSSVTGKTSSDKTGWFEDLPQELSTLPNIKAVIFYDDNYKGSDFRLNSGMDLDILFANSINNNSYFLKDPQYVLAPQNSQNFSF